VNKIKRERSRKGRVEQKGKGSQRLKNGKAKQLA
jgi:hypothetical protein